MIKVCDHCNTFYKDIKPHWHTDEKGWQEIISIAEKIKEEGKGKDFDIVDYKEAIEGGADIVTFFSFS